MWTIIAHYRGEIVRVDNLTNIGLMLEAIANMNGSTQMVAITEHGFYRTVLNRAGDNAAIMYCSGCNAITSTVAGIEPDNYGTCAACGHRQPAIVKKERKPYTYKTRS